MDPLSALQSVMTKPFRFSGRATRSEFWWFFLLDLGIFGVLSSVDAYMLFIDQAWMANPLSLSPFDFLTVWWTIIGFFPRISVTIRRLHDANMSGFLFLLTLVPLVGYLLVLALCAMGSDPRVNSYGQPPDAGHTVRKDGAPSGQRDHLQAYSALFEMEAKASPEYREAFEARRKQEVRALYEQRILGRQSSEA